jgi:selenocysteine-specific elongation factor
VGDIRRGDTLISPSTFNAVWEVDTEVRLLQGSPPLKDSSEISFHAFTSGVSARVSLYDSKILEPGQSGLAKLKLNHPIVLLPHDRFVLRQPSPPATIGGGEVLDATPIPKLPRVKRIEWLKALRNSSPEGQLLLRVTRRHSDGISAEHLSRESGLAPEATSESMIPLIASQQVVLINEKYYISAPALSSAASRVLSEVKLKITDTLNPGWKRSELKHRTGLNEVVSQFVITMLEREQKLTLREDRVVLAGSTANTNSVDSQKVAALAQAYASAGMNAPLLQSVAGLLKVGEPELRRLMTVLLRDKVLVKLGGDDLYMHRDALGKLYAQVRTLRGQLMDVGRFKQMTGLSRKYAIPLLEHLDREHITRKQGDSRLVL